MDFYYEGKLYTEKIGKVSKTVALEKLDIKRSEVIRGEWEPKTVKISFDKFKEQYLELTKGGQKAPVSNQGRMFTKRSLKNLRRKDAVRNQPDNDCRIQKEASGRGGGARNDQSRVGLLAHHVEPGSVLGEAPEAFLWLREEEGQISEGAEREKQNTKP